VSFIDKAINKVFSKRITKQIKEEAEIIAEQGIEKMKAQLGYGGYGSNGHAGGYGGAKWEGGLSSDGSPLILDHSRLRRNARNAYHGTPQAKSLVDRYADTVADTGLMLEPAPKAEILGISTESAERWASMVSESFDSWARSKNQHRAGTINFYQSQRLYQIFQHRDNDIFTRLYYSSEKKLLNPLQYEFIDPDQIRGDALTTNYGFQGNDDGIIRDSQGRETAYRICIKEKDKNKIVQFKPVTIPAIGERSKRIFMLHGFIPEYAGQGRGYSRLAHALQEFQNITDFSLAQIKKAINESSITMYVKPSPDAPASNPVVDALSRGGAGPVANQVGSNPTPSECATNTQATVAFNELPETTRRAPGSDGYFNLEGGEDLKPFQGTAPAASFDKFVDAFTSHLSASLSMPLEVMLMKFNQNYSASRGSLILFWRVAQIFRDEMASDFLNPIYEMWLAGEIAAGRISAPGWLDPRLRAAWLNNRWIGSPMPNIDPKRTADADMTYVELGAQTLDRVAKNLNGSSGKTNRAKLTREYSELPIAPWNKNNNNN
jgi:lambda family phage portal protein